MRQSQLRRMLYAGTLKRPARTARIIPCCCVWIFAQRACQSGISIWRPYLYLAVQAQYYCLRHLTRRASTGEKRYALFLFCVLQTGSSGAGVHYVGPITRANFFRAACAVFRVLSAAAVARGRYYPKTRVPWSMNAVCLTAGGSWGTAKAPAEV